MLLNYTKLNKLNYTEIKYYEISLMQIFGTFFVTLKSKREVDILLIAHWDINYINAGWEGI